MKFCYVDESGTGDEPYAVMVGVMVDALRMRPTKSDWDALLTILSRLANRRIDEIHTRDFYAGNGPWRGLEGSIRAEIIDRVLDWLTLRKHLLVYCAVDKEQWFRDFPGDARHATVSTLWRFLGLHLVLAIQKHNQCKLKNKGNTVLIIDNEERERVRFTDLVLNPPDWTHSYYGKSSRQDAFDQIVDAPYFADSKDVPLLQVADFAAFFLRRHLELEAGDPERYDGECARVGAWAAKALKRSIPKAAIYPRRDRCQCSQLFYDYAPPLLR
ncbi:MAG: DUF3800 domain-containing protein [Deltaproteobacteria bacterium]|nr:DUF3800 domain-containing protein [Deltaproteobacteria bacterium]